MIEKQPNNNYDHTRDKVDFAPWSKAESESRETLNQRHIAFAMIKPGFEEYEQEIVRILKENSLDVIFSDRVRLSSDFIDRIYKDQNGQPFLPAIKEYLMKSDVIILMVGGNGDDAQEILSSLKKTRDGKDGLIREKFQGGDRVSENDIALWKEGSHPDQDNLTILLTQQNVIHTADSADEALESLEMLLGDKFDGMRKRGMLASELWDYFQG